MLDESARLTLASTRFRDVRWYDEVDSTNLVAADLVRRGAGDGLVVVADYQTAGRGRLDRRWQAPRGSSLLVSVVVAPEVAAGRVHLLTGAMAVAASVACGEVAGVEPLLKWPNDLLIGERKVGGILGEVVAGVAILGLGVNVNWGGVSPPPPGIALDEVVGASREPLDRSTLLVALLCRLDGVLADLDPHRLREESRTRSATLGRRVRVDLLAGSVVGEAVDLTLDGHLVVQTAGGSRRVVAAGDVLHLRGADE